MPGGFCRISDRADARAVSMGAGVESADVWVLGDKPAELVTLLPADDRCASAASWATCRAAPPTTCSGSAATWSAARRSCGWCAASPAGSIDAGTSTRRPRRSRTAWRPPRRLAARCPRTAPLKGCALAALRAVGEDELGSAVALLRDARRAASFIRERLSADAWRLIEDLHDLLRRDTTAPLTEADVLDRAEAALRTLAAISGLSQENMNRGAGWHLLDMGRRVERAINTCRFARDFAGGSGSADGLERAARADRLADHLPLALPRRRRLRPVRDMVLLDALNPRSVAFQVERLGEHLAGLPPLEADGMLEEPRRLVVKLAADVATAAAAALDPAAVLGFERALLALADAIAARYFLQGPHLARQEKAEGLA